MSDPATIRTGFALELEMNGYTDAEIDYLLNHDFRAFMPWALRTGALLPPGQIKGGATPTSRGG